MNFSDPLHNILRMGLKEGMKVADLGTGSGHYAISAGHIVGPTGRVYAVDIQEDILTRLTAEAKVRGLTNIETIWADFEHLEGTTLRPRVLDAVVLSNTLFQLEKKEGALAEIKRILKPGGKLLVVDWMESFGGIGPHKEHVVPEAEAEALFIKAGFTKLKAFLGGPYHYSLLFEAP